MMHLARGRLSRDAVRLTDCPRADPRCVSFRRDEQCLTGPPPDHPMHDRVSKRVEAQTLNLCAHERTGLTPAEINSTPPSSDEATRTH